MAALIPPPLCLLEERNIPEKHLTGPGPSNAYPSVLQASSKPLLGHLHPEFLRIMDDVKAGIQYAFQTKNPVTLAISGTGHAAMEAACVNLVEPDDKVLVAVNGIWGRRFADLVKRQGGVSVEIDKGYGSVFSLEEIEKELRIHRPSLLFITHGESSGATLQPLEGLGSLCHRYGCLLLVDSVAAMGGVPLFMDKWEIDALYSGSQKVLSCPPGVSPISINGRAWKKIQTRKTPIASFYFDLTWLANYWGCDGQPRRYHHTGPISSIYAIREGLAILTKEGLKDSWARHQNCANELYAGLKSLGLHCLVENESHRLPTVTAVLVPPGVDWKQVVNYAMTKHQVELSGGLGEMAGKIWRIGLMGHNATSHVVNLILNALSEALKHAGQPLSKI